jgi:type IV pilus assembly protein PilP
MAGCSGGQSDLEKWIAETKKKPGGRIEPLPEVKPYETFTYNANGMRSPFQPVGPNTGQSNLRPSIRRNREFLEGFSLDTLKMVGTFKVGSSFLWARAVQRRVGPQGAAGQLHWAERRKNHRHHGRQN